MRKKFEFIGLLISFILSFFVFHFSSAQENLVEVQSVENYYFICKNGLSIRTLRVQSEKTICKAIYTKEGIDQIVGKSMISDQCQQIVDRIKLKLEAGKWICKDIGNSKISSSVN